MHRFTFFHRLLAGFAIRLFVELLSATVQLCSNFYKFWLSSADIFRALLITSPAQTLSVFYLWFHTFTSSYMCVCMYSCILVCMYFCPYFVNYYLGTQAAIEKFIHLRHFLSSFEMFNDLWWYKSPISYLPQCSMVGICAFALVVVVLVFFIVNAFLLSIVKMWESINESK